MCERLVCSAVVAAASVTAGAAVVRGAARRALAAVVGLELVDVGRERARRLDARLQALEQARLARPGDRAGARGRRRRSASKTRPSTPSRIASARPPRRGGDAAARGRPGTRPPPAARSPTTCEGMTATSTPASSSGSSAGEKAPHSSTTPRGSSGAQARGEALAGPRRGSSTRTSALGALRRLDQQLRALVRVGRAEEGDGQALAGAARPPVAPELLPRISSAAGTAWRTTSIISRRVACAGERARASASETARQTRHAAREAVADARQALLRSRRGRAARRRTTRSRAPRRRGRRRSRRRP